MEQQSCEGRPECFILIRFPMSRQQSAKNSLIKNLSIHSNYAGDVSGICPNMTVLEGPGAPDRGIAMICFRTRDEAIRWAHSCPEIKQQDWQGGVDILLVPVADMPDPHCMQFVQVLDLTFYTDSDFERFASDYSPEASSILKQHNARQIVSTSNAQKLRGLWDPNYIVINAWGNEDCFGKAYYGDDNKGALPKRQNVSEANVSVFKLEPLIYKH